VKKLVVTDLIPPKDDEKMRELAAKKRISKARLWSAKI
jgi:hypothetical protein